MVLCPGLPKWAGTRKVKPIWILLKQETVSGSSISWTICKSAPCFRQITKPAPHHSVFTGLLPFLPPNQQRQSTTKTKAACNDKIVFLKCIKSYKIAIQLLQSQNVTPEKGHCGPQLTALSVYKNTLYRENKVHHYFPQLPLLLLSSFQQLLQLSLVLFLPVSPDIPAVCWNLHHQSKQQETAGWNEFNNTVKFINGKVKKKYKPIVVDEWLLSFAITKV